MAYDNLTFKKLDNGYYETFFKGESTRIFFKVPDGFDIRDYPINTFGKCTEINNESAYFELAKEPHETFSIDIATDAGLNFPKEFPIKIGSKLTLGHNDNMTIKTVDSPDLYFDDLKIEKNRNSVITFTSNKLKRLSQKELKDGKLDIDGTSITSNNNINILINDSCFIKFIDNLSVLNQAKSKIDISKVRYINIHNATLSPEQSFNTFSVDVDLFIWHYSNIRLVKEDGNIKGEKAKSSSIKMTNSSSKDFTSVDIKSAELSFFNGGNLKIDAKKLELGKAGEERRTIRFWGDTKLRGKENISIDNSTFTDAAISSENQELYIQGSDLQKATINFLKNGKDNSVSKIMYSTITNSILDNISGDLRGTISWVKANNIILGEDARFIHNVFRNELPESDYLLNLNNITIAPNGYVCFDDGENVPRSLNNCYFEGEISVESDCPYEINSSTIKNNNSEESTVFINSTDTPLIEGVLLNGDVEIKNIDKLSYSEISNSKLLSPYRVNVSDLFLNNETMTHFSANDVEHKVDSRVTDELEIL